MPETVIWAIAGALYLSRGLMYVWEYLDFCDQEGIIQAPGAAVLISVGMVLFWPAIPLYEICAALFRGQ